MTFERFLTKGDAFIFGFDEVLYPEKDFLLQVYYLFANFIEYAEQKPATEILQFMKADFEKYGAEGIFERTAVKWDIPEKYKLNFDLLITGARLPLKLELFPQMLDFLIEIKNSGKSIFLLLNGNPEQQLNKIRQTNWQELAESLVVYFIEETEEQSTFSGLINIINKHKLDQKRTFFIGVDEVDLNAALTAEIKYSNVSELLIN
ncbi:FMN phosphatase YigB (HAD superfamily) [Pedobacter sp. UYP24]